MLLTPRSYQIECEQSLWRYFETHTGNPLCALPTGTGKSVVIAMFLYNVLRAYQRQKIVVCTHVQELIQQNYQKLLQFWPSAPAGINSAGLGQRDTMHPILFAGIQSVAKYFASFGHVDLVIIDEAHLVSPEDETRYKMFIAGLKSINPYLKVIGLTATPWRLGHGRITEGEGALFTDMCFDITGLEAFNRLIEEAFLAPLIPKKTHIELEVDGVHLRGQEFIASELQVAVDKEAITRAALEETMESGRNRNKWLLFASGVEHAQHISDMLQDEFGIFCPAIHRKTHKDDRRKYLQAFRDGEIRAVVNNNILTTGLDVPDIDLITVLRPTCSPVLWVQMLGRGTRPVYAPGYDLQMLQGRLAAIANSGKQDCLVLDFAGNTRRLGPINDPVIPRKKGERGGDAPVKICDRCGTYNHTSVRKCICCGFEFPIQTKFTPTASTEELIKGDLPITEVFKIDHVSYSEHNKVGRPPSMKLMYYCGIRSFSEYVTPEYPGPAGGRAKKWWKERADTMPPTKTAEMLERTDELRTPTHLRVWINKQYPQIIAHCYDGTAFGQHPPKDSDSGPSTDVQRPQVRTNWADRLGPNPPASQGVDMDDDIPF
jgi:DNA repair protein RadD